MAVSQELVAKFKADTADFNNKVKGVKREIDSVGSSAKKMSNDVDASAKNASASLATMSLGAKAVVTAIGTATVAIGAFSIKVGSDMESATKRIEAMLGSVEKSQFVLSNLREAGYESGASVIALTESYGKLATFVENGSISLQESVDIQKGLTSTATALGASSEQLSTVMYGLSQAMGSGVVRAEEFNQVTEPLPGIINRMEKATGLASGELRGMVNDGLITSQMFKNILIPALKSFEGQAEDMKDTLKVQAGIMSNTATALGEDLYDGIAPSLTSLISLVNELGQRLVSVQRASNNELKNRLKDIKERREAITSGMGVREDSSFLGNFVKITDTEATKKEKKEELARLFKMEAEINAKLYQTPETDDATKTTDKPTAFDAELAKLQAQYREKLAKREGGKGSARKSARKPIKLKSKIEKEEVPLFKEKFEDYQKDLGNFSLETVKEFDLVESMFGDMKDSIISGFVTMSSAGKTSFKDMARSIIGDIQSIITRTLLMKAIAGIGSAITGYFAPAYLPVSTGGSGVGFGANGASGFLSGARANGGFVGANKAYLVGERGPEILKMGSQSGNVISNEKSFGGSTVINIDARGASAGVEHEIRRVMGEIMNLKKQVPNIAISAVKEQNSRNSGFLR